MQNFKASTIKRLNRELEKLESDPLPNCVIAPIDDNDLSTWQATLQGPEKSPYEEGVFIIHLKIPNEYPFKPPAVNFLTKIFHPNIHDHVCMHTLHDGWSPAIFLRALVQEICNLLINPDFSNICIKYDDGTLPTNDDRFQETARDWTRKYA